jgi:hypothetical protein
MMKPTNEVPPLGQAWEKFKADNQHRLEAIRELHSVAPKQTLVETVARRLALAEGKRWIDLNYVQIEQFENVAQTAIAACHAEELETALRQLLDDTQHRNHDCGDTPEDCPVLAARALLAKIEERL